MSQDLFGELLKVAFGLRSPTRVPYFLGIWLQQVDTKLCSQICVGGSAIV